MSLLVVFNFVMSAVHLGPMLGHPWWWGVPRRQPHRRQA